MTIFKSCADPVIPGKEIDIRSPIEEEFEMKMHRQFGAKTEACGELPKSNLRTWLIAECFLEFLKMTATKLETVSNMTSDVEMRAELRKMAAHLRRQVAMAAAKGVNVEDEYGRPA